MIGSCVNILAGSLTLCAKTQTNHFKFPRDEALHARRETRARC